MKKETRTYKLVIIVVFSLAIIYLISIINNFSNNYLIDSAKNRELKEKELRLLICYDYAKNNGDFVWRHDKCAKIEKEILIK